MRPKRGGNTSKWDVPQGRKLAFWQRVTPPQLFVGSFGLLVVLGTWGLMFLPGLYVDEPLNWLDALFTATSAVCVTGLIVVDTGTYFTAAGQAYLLLLIQLGGLGLLTFTSLIIVALGRRLSLREEALSTGAVDAAPHIDHRRLTFDIVRFTLIFEVAGALLLYLLWIPRFGWFGAFWPAVFHSVSAFCNAGFSIFSNSLVDFQHSPFSLLVVMVLIVAGGLGFLTQEEVYLRFRAHRRKQVFRVSLHSRIVLLTTALLLVGGWILYSLFEWDHSLIALGGGHKLVNSLFMSVTCRTAGFNTIDYGEASDSANLLTMLLMTIGGSPGSTAGGMKTTTFAVIGLLAWSRLRGWESTTFGSRSLPVETTSRAVGLFVIASGLATAGIFLLTTTEHYAPAQSGLVERMFEAISAFNTVGLSLGITPELSRPGRWVTTLLMFLGRVGPLTLAAALTLPQTGKTGFRYAHEDVVVG